MRKSLISISLLAACASIARPQPVIAQDSNAVPLNDPATWVSSDDYPVRALRLGLQGAVGFRLTVDSAGAVTACVITSSSGSPELDGGTCNLLTVRARFVPNPAGPSTFGSRIVWRIPATIPRQPSTDGPGMTLAQP